MTFIEFVFYFTVVSAISVTAFCYLTAYRPFSKCINKLKKAILAARIAWKN